RPAHSAKIPGNRGFPAVLKTVEPHGSVGSNPTPAAYLSGGRRMVAVAIETDLDRAMAELGESAFALTPSAIWLDANVCRHAWRPMAARARSPSRLIAAEHDAGRSLGQIARGLNADRVRRAHGGARWWPSTVRCVLNCVETT